MLKGGDFSYPPVKQPCYHKFVKNCHILSLYPEPVTLGHFLNNCYSVVSHLDSEKTLYKGPRLAFSLVQWISKCVLGQAATLGNVLEMQVLGPGLRLTELTAPGMGPGAL